MFEIIDFATIVGAQEGWGREQGRGVFQKLLKFVEDNPGISTFRISMKGFRQMDLSFASETLVELARRFRKAKSFCLVNLSNLDLMENLDAAAKKKEQPLMVWNHDKATVLGLEPSEGNKDALEFALSRENCRAAEFASAKSLSIANASMKFKQLWEQGFLMRWERSAESGGVEYVYERIY
jgi:hypothetical protein